MANPQKENGHIRIATELFEALCKIRISGEARQMLDIIIRKTYGWNKKKDKISLSQFAKASGMNRQSCLRAVRKLELMNLIVIKKDNSFILTYSINKNYETWKPLSKKRTVTTVIKKDNALLSKKIIGVINKDYKTVINKDYHNNQINTTTKNTITREDEILTLWIKTFGKNPNIPEQEETQKLINQFGIEKVYRILREASLRKFKSILTLIKSLDEHGNIKPWEKNNGNNNGNSEKNFIPPERFETELPTAFH